MFSVVSIPKEFHNKIKEIIDKTGLYLNVADFVREATRLRAEELLKQIEQEDTKEMEPIKIPT
jgi:Arc/MetJ-type ribon-helix-helix transcriptional regulator